MTDPIKRAMDLRTVLKKDDKIMVINFPETLLGKDTDDIKKFPNVHTGEVVFRNKINVVDIDPFFAKGYRRKFQDIRQMSEQGIEQLVRTAEFDFPLWFKHRPGFDMRKIMDYNPGFIAEVAGCNFNGGKGGGCRYCYNDDKSNEGCFGKDKALLSADAHLDSMLAARERMRRIYAEKGFDLNLRVLRLSGGEPTLVLDYLLDLLRKAESRGLALDYHLDTNLSTGSVIDALERDAVYEKDILNKLAKYDIKVLAAIKGTDDANIQDNTRTSTTIADQKYSIAKFLNAGFDLFFQMYNPNPESLRQYLEDMDSMVENFALRLHIGQLHTQAATADRIDLEAKANNVDPAYFRNSAEQKWKRNYEASIPILEEYLTERYGVQYKQLTRSDVPIQLIGPKV